MLRIVGKKLSQHPSKPLKSYFCAAGFLFTLKSTMKKFLMIHR
eukprot:UN08514